jgi:hypothetical protein
VLLSDHRHAADLWHGLLNPGFEATSLGEMAVHLLTVHLPLYVGVVGLFAAIMAALVRDRHGTGLWVALGGSAIQVVGEGWHAWTHPALAPDPVVPAMLGLGGFAAAIIALGLEWHRRHRALRAD